MKVSVANRSTLLTKTNFKNYDLCLNPYVGCEFGCSYCYVRFFVKDDEEEWGHFVRARLHMEEKLPKELDKGYVRVSDGTFRDESGAKKTRKRDIEIEKGRLVLGTMTDPYQPVEKKHRVTRTALEIITKHSRQFEKVGIFTRSPLVLQDLDLIKKLPRARVHFTVTPFPPEIMRAIEPISPRTDSRWAVVQKLKEAGIRVHVNVSPVIPLLSDGFAKEFVGKLIDLRVDEYFVDPMQPYSESFEAFKAACVNTDVDWASVERIMMDKKLYEAWKVQFWAEWNSHRLERQGEFPEQLPIWSDHENHVWMDMRSGKQMSHRQYGDG